MRNFDDRKVLAFLAPVLALVLAGAVIAGGLNGQQQNGNLEEQVEPPGGGDDDCICSHVYDPVVCWPEGPTVIGPAAEPREFSNACFAGCAGYTRCRPASTGR